MITAVLCFLLMLLNLQAALADTNPKGFAILPPGTLDQIDRVYEPEPEPETVIPWDGETEPEEGTGEETDPERRTQESGQGTQPSVWISRTEVNGMMWNWVVGVSGVQSLGSFDYVIVEPTRVNGEIVNYARAQKLNSPYWNYYYQFEYNGNYELWVYVKNTGGNIVAFGRFPFAVNVAGHDRLMLNFTGPETVTNISSPTSWSAYASGGTGGYTWSFQLSELQTNVTWNGYKRDTVTATDGYVGYGVFSYQFVCNGDYQLVVWLRDDSGHQVSGKKQIRVNASGVPTITQRASQLISQCRVQGNTTDYQIARWSHDWLINNTNYDYGEPTHYGADRALMGQNIVCQGYAVAFCTLMKAAGIPCEYVRNSEGDHGWDVVKLGGKWYQVDCTWDDGSSGSGFDSHQFCFVTDEAMHVEHNYECSRRSNSIEYNYYVQEHIADTWYLNLCDQVQAKLQQGSYVFSVPLATKYTAEGHTFLASETVGVTADTACEKFIPYYNNSFSWQGTPVPLSLNVTRASRMLWSEVDFTGRILTLPASLKRIEGEAFAGDKTVMAVIVPEGVTEIKAGAFDGCTGLWKVVLPSTIRTIEPNAFRTGTNHLCIVEPSKGTGYTYATNNGLWYVSLQGSN